MMAYRALLVDTENTYARPIQAFFMDLKKARQWADKMLPTSGDHAYVAIYQVREKEVATISKEQVVGRSRDESAIPDLQSSKP